MYKGKNIFAKMMDENMVIFSPIPVKVGSVLQPWKTPSGTVRLAAVEYVSGKFHCLAKNILSINIYWTKIIYYGIILGCNFTVQLNKKKAMIIQA